MQSTLALTLVEYLAWGAITLGGACVTFALLVFWSERKSRKRGL